MRILPQGHKRDAKDIVIGLYVTSTTGTTIETYLGWIREELAKREYGKVSIEFTICNGQITRVDRTALDTDQIPLQRKG